MGKGKVKIVSTSNPIAYADKNYGRETEKAVEKMAKKYSKGTAGNELRNQLAQAVFDLLLKK